MSRFNSLVDWLSWQEQLHSKNIDLGLERVFTVATRLGLLNAPTEISHAYSGSLRANEPSADQTVITIAGTNGKGSCVTTLEKCLGAQGCQVGSYTSPHLHHYCERIRIDGQPVSESIVCDAFSAIDEARGDISLTYFEFGTLAALWIFSQANIPYVLLEVGLGGRLDAVNIVDSDVAVITSIDIDHEDWLGSDRNIISQEKLGVARAFKPLIIAEMDLTPALLTAANDHACLLIGRDYRLELCDEHSWCWILESSRSGSYSPLSEDNLEKKMDLPLPSLPVNSVAAAICVLECLGRVPQDIAQIVSSLSLSGRFEQATIGDMPVIFDVAHNPAAARALAQRLDLSKVEGRTLAVTAMMADKDHQQIIQPLSAMIDYWYLGNLSDNPRALESGALADLLEAQDQTSIVNPTIEAAFKSALADANAGDRIVVFGSFFTVAAIQAFIDDKESS